MLAFYCFITPLLFLKVIVRGVCTLAHEVCAHACGCALRRVVDLSISQQVSFECLLYASFCAGHW